MALTFVQPPSGVTKLNVMVYGGPKSGKTVNALSLTELGPVLIANAEGPDALAFSRLKWGNEKIREVAIERKSDLDEIYLYLREGKGKEAAVVVDSLGEIYRVVLEELARANTGKMAGKPMKEQFGEAQQTVERFCRALRDLPITVVLIAHELHVTTSDEDGNERTEVYPFVGTSNIKLGQKLMAMQQVVAYASVLPADDEEGAPRPVVQVVKAKGRHGGDRTGVIAGPNGVGDFNIPAWITKAQAAHSTGKAA